MAFRFMQVICLLFLVVGVVFGGTYSGGVGTIDQPYEIANSSDLVEIGNTPSDFNSYFVLTDDIEMTGVSTFVPIGYYSSTSLTSGVPFAGCFDGQGFSISNLTISSDKPGIGVFGIVDSATSVIENVTVVNPVFSTTSTSGRIGGLSGYFDGQAITNCHVINPTLTGGPATGGLMGTSWSRPVAISYCSVQSGSVVGKNNLGGLAGAITPGDSAYRCWSSATVTCNGTSSSTSHYVGGFAGYINSTSGKITGVSECYSTGDVNGAAISDYVGGFTGSNSATISNCYALGEVSGRNQVGGFSGYHGHNGTPTYVENCYSIGKVFGTGSYVGGFTGQLFTYQAYCDNCYWDTESSEMTVSGEGFALTTGEMFSQTNYANWDFTGVWTMLGANYPELRYIFNQCDFNVDESVDMRDLSIFAASWGTTLGEESYNQLCDFQEPADGVVDIEDLTIFVSNWLGY